MALQPVRSDLYPPNRSKTFTLPVGASTVLHVAGASAPASINHLPATIHLNITTGGTWIWKDVDGTSNTVTYAAGALTLPYTAASIEIGTAIGTATVSWHPEP
jgi:hypothetical protein